MRLIVIVSGLALVCPVLSSFALAGLVLTQETTTSSIGGNLKDNRTVMIEGHKQKLILKGQTVIIDLDKGQVILVDPAAHTYSPMDFPPRGRFAQMMQTMGGFNLDFTKTGQTSTVAGYSCEEYTGAGRLAIGEYTVKACFSSDAPGAAEYSAFDHLLALKLKNSAMATMKSPPPKGIPLLMNTTTKINSFSIPGVTPEQAKMIGRMMANRPPAVTNTIATSIKEQTLPPDTFEVPSNYTRKEFEMPAMAAPHHPAAGSGSSPTESAGQ